MTIRLINKIFNAQKFHKDFFKFDAIFALQFFTCSSVYSHLKSNIFVERRSQASQKNKDCLHYRVLIKIILRPKTESPENAGKLLDEGMSVARLNFSHGDH